MRKDRLDGIGVLALVGVTLLLAANQIMVKFVNHGLQPVFFAGLRSLLGTLFVWLWLWARGRPAVLRALPRLPPAAAGCSEGQRAAGRGEPRKVPSPHTHAPHSTQAAGRQARPPAGVTAAPPAARAPPPRAARAPPRRRTRARLCAGPWSPQRAAGRTTACRSRRARAARTTGCRVGSRGSRPRSDRQRSSASTSAASTCCAPTTAPW